MCLCNVLTFIHQCKVWVEDICVAKHHDHLVGQREVWVEDVAHAQHRPLAVLGVANCKNNQLSRSLIIRESKCVNQSVKTRNRPFSHKLLMLEVTNGDNGMATTEGAPPPLSCIHCRIFHRFVAPTLLATNDPLIFVLPNPAKIFVLQNFLCHRFQRPALASDKQTSLQLVLNWS